MTKEEYSIDEIMEALNNCPKYNVEVKIPPHFDSDLDTTMVTVEVKYFLWHLSQIKPKQR